MAGAQVESSSDPIETTSPTYVSLFHRRSTEAGYMVGPTTYRSFAFWCDRYATGATNRSVVLVGNHPSAPFIYHGHILNPLRNFFATYPGDLGASPFDHLSVSPIHRSALLRVVDRVYHFRGLEELDVRPTTYNLPFLVLASTSNQEPIVVYVFSESETTYLAAIYAAGVRPTFGVFSKYEGTYPVNEPGHDFCLGTAPRTLSQHFGDHAVVDINSRPSTSDSDAMECVVQRAIMTLGVHEATFSGRGVIARIRRLQVDGPNVATRVAMVSTTTPDDNDISCVQFEPRSGRRTGTLAMF